jgi:hypothetical protein
MFETTNQKITQTWEFSLLEGFLGVERRQAASSRGSWALAVTLRLDFLDQPGAKTCFNMARKTSGTTAGLRQEKTETR